MSVDSVLQQIRPFVHLFGIILITIGALKMLGVNIDLVRGEFWQIALTGLAVKSW